MQMLRHGKSPPNVIPGVPADRPDPPPVTCITVAACGTAGEAYSHGQPFGNMMLRRCAQPDRIDRQYGKRQGDAGDGNFRSVASGARPGAQNYTDLGLAAVQFDAANPDRLLLLRARDDCEKQPLDRTAQGLPQRRTEGLQRPCLRQRCANETHGCGIRVQAAIQAGVGPRQRAKPQRAGFKLDRRWAIRRRVAQGVSTAAACIAASSAASRAAISRSGCNAVAGGTTMVACMSISAAGSWPRAIRWIFGC